MSYINDNLLPNEKVLFTGKVSPAVYLRPLICFLIFCLVAYKTLDFASSKEQLSQILTSISCFLSFCLIASTIFLVLEAFITIKTNEFAVTNQRLMAKTGFIRRKIIEIPLIHLESVSVDQGILGRMLNFGTIEINGSGGTSYELRAIINPLAIRKNISQVIQYIHSQSKNNPN